MSRVFEAEIKNFDDGWGVQIISVGECIALPPMRKTCTPHPSAYPVQIFVTN